MTHALKRVCTGRFVPAARRVGMPGHTRPGSTRAQAKATVNTAEGQYAYPSNNDA